MKKIIIGLFCLLFFDNIFADSYFDVIATDISQEYLKILFGKIESVFPLAKKGLLGEIFGVFNSIALSIGGYILLYIIVVSTINTAATGEVMGKSWSSIWIPLRAVLGIALLVPKSSGYCTIQGIIMWVVVQGIGVANHLWDSTVDTVSKKGPLVNPLDNNNSILLSLFKPENQVRYLVMQTSASAYLTNNVIMTRIEEELNKKRQNAIKNLQDDLQIVQDNRIKYEAAKAKILAEGGSVLDNVIIDENGVMIIEPEEGAEQRILDAMNNYPMVPSFRDTVNFNNTTIEMPGNFGDTEVDKAYNDLYGGISYYKISDFIKVNKQSAYEVKKLAHSTLFMSTSLLAEQIVDGATWNAIGDKYFSDIEIAWGILIDGLDLFDPILLSTFYISAKKNGWLGAGKYFYDLVQQQAAITAVEDGYTGIQFEMVNILKKYEDRVKGLGDFKTLTNGQKIPVLTKTELTSIMKGQFINNDTKQHESLIEIIIKSSVLNKTGVYYLQNKVKELFENKMTGEGLTSNSESMWILGVVQAWMTIFVMTIVGLVSAINAIAGLAAGAVLAASCVRISSGLSSLLSGSTTPISDLAMLGAGMVDIALTTFTVVAGALFGGTIAMSAMAGFQPAPFAIMTVVAFITPILTAILTGMIIGGALLYLYVPVIPVIVFLFSAIGWFFAVLEAMVAAPLVALGLMYPEGHEVFGKAESALMLLLNVFLRPGLLIIGFVVSSMLATMSIWILNRAIGSGLSQSLGDPSISVGLSIFIAIPTVIMIYGYIIVWLLQTIFDFIPKFADGVLKWIGGTVTSYSTDAAQGKGQQAYSSVSSTAGQAAGTMQKSGEALGKQAGKKGESAKLKGLDTEDKSAGKGGNDSGKASVHLGNDVASAKSGGSGAGGGRSRSGALVGNDKSVASGEHNASGRKSSSTAPTSSSKNNNSG